MDILQLNDIYSLVAMGGLAVVRPTTLHIGLIDCNRVGVVTFPDASSSGS